MIEMPLTTKYASPERDDYETVLEQKKIVDKITFLKPFLDNIPAFILVLNKNRQIVFVNKVFNDFLGTDSILGMRPGEAVNCIHAWEEKAGCGTSEFCTECGAVNAILNCQIKGFDTQECRITQNNNQFLDLNVWTKQIILENTEFTLFSFVDISNEKRRKVLERIFFHDVLNTAGSLSGFLEIIQDCKPEEKDEFLKIAEDISEKLIDEIKSQRNLTLAEDGELQLIITAFSTKEVLEELVLLYKNHKVAEGKKIQIEQNCADEIITSDKTVLRRVLSNLTKNALEASKENSTVLLNCKYINNKVIFYVKNEDFIPIQVQHQLFQRSFSTKGFGRGIGTYSVKLLTENYLKGIVSFESSETTGTVFMATYPKNF
ncbi:MAG: histidine kinase [Ignavibacteriales bacterium CG18_big_fil_WC_8_21_14_2_50_31_20]|nr:MAG: histidine kinase [Ignavibacteriales bacterium CG18_big_fil_WC_8_21_14_2_50_31_20]